MHTLLWLLHQLRQCLRCRAPVRKMLQIHRQQRYEAHSAAQRNHALREATTPLPTITTLQVSVILHIQALSQNAHRKQEEN